MSKLISTIPALLNWQDSSLSRNQIHNRYVEKVINVIIEKCQNRNHRELRADILMTLNKLLCGNPLSAMDFITAPRTINKLIFEDVSSIDILHYLQECNLVEEYISGKEIHTNKNLTSATTRHILNRTDNVNSIFMEDQTGYGKIILDTRSHLVTDAPKGEDKNRDQGIIEFLSGEDLDLSLKYVNSTLKAIELNSKYAFDFIGVFTKTLVLRNISNKQYTSSGSCGQYIGMSVITNPIISFRSNFKLADQIVHEAIHSVLYMSEFVQPWFTDSHLRYDPNILIKSPWTGNLIRLAPFLQACFVWYGLAKFWTLENAKIIFGENSCIEASQLAIRGFLVTDLLSIIQNWEKFLDDDLLITITLMQSDIRRENGKS